MTSSFEKEDPFWCAWTVQEIKLSLGADILGKILTETVEPLDKWLIAVETRLGWTVMG